MKKKVLSMLLVLVMLLQMIPVVATAYPVPTIGAQNAISKFEQGIPMSVSHRAAWRNGPECSLIALAASIKMGIDVAELDVKLTSDGVVVLSHDESVSRCVVGETGNVSSYTWEQVKSMALEPAQGGSNQAYTLTEADAALLNSLPNYAANSGEAVAGGIMPLTRLDDALDLIKALGPNTMINLDHCFSQERFVACYQVFREKGMLGNVFFKNSNGVSTMNAWYAAAAENWNAKHPDDTITADDVKNSILYVYIIRSADYSPLQAHLDAGSNLVMAEICITDDSADAAIHAALEPWCKENGVAMFINTMWSGLCSTKADTETTWAEMLDRGYVAIQTDQASELALYLYNYNRTRASSETVQAEHFNLFNYDSYSFSVPESCDSSLNKKVNGMRNGDWMSYKMSFAGDETIMNLTLQGLDSSAEVNVYLDEMTEANLIASVRPGVSAAFQTVSAEITGTVTAGNHTLYIQTIGLPETSLVSADSFSFVPAADFEGEMEVETISVTTEPGVAPELPGTVTVTAGETTYGLSVRWEQIPAESYAQEGSFTVLGYVPVLKSYIRANVTVSAVVPGISQEGLALWLDASKDVTAEGGAVSAWKSQIGDITATLQDGSPTLVENAIGGEGGIRFDGDDSLTLTLPDGFWTSTESGQYTVLMYVSADKATNGNSSTVSGASTRSSQEYSVMWFPEVADWGGVYFTASQSEVIWRFGSGSTDDRGTTYDRPASVGSLYNAAAIRKDGKTNTVFVDGKNVYNNTAVSAVTNNTGSQGHIGAGQYGNFSGTICQILIYNRALSDAEIVAAQRWMAEKYADTISSVETVSVSCEVGQAAELPGTVKVTYESGAENTLAVSWDAVNPNAYLNAGTFEVQGTLPNGQAVSATVTVTAETVTVFPEDNVLLWFSAQSGLTADTDGTVSAWVDKATGTVTASQSTADGQPTLVKDSSGKVIGVRFDGGDKMTFNAGKDTFNDLSGLTMVVYSKPETTAPTGITNNHTKSVIYFGEYGAGWSGMYMGTFTNGAAARFGTSTTNYRGILYTGGSYEGYTTTVLRKNGAEIDELIINGTAIANPTSTGVVPGEKTKCINGETGVLGQGKNNTYWTGTVSEILIFDKTLTDAELQTVYDYLEETYNPKSTTVATDGLILWLDAASGITTGEDGKVTGWTSKAGNVAAQEKTSEFGNVKTAPTFVSDAINGEAGVQFGGSDVMVVQMADGTFNDLTGVTVIAYAASNTAINTSNLGYNGQRNTLFFVDEAGSWGSFYTGIYSNAVSARFGSGVSNDSGFSVARSESVTDFTTTVIRWDGSTKTYDADVNGADFTTATSKSGVTGNNKSIIYLGTGKEDKNWTGTLSELLIYNRVLTDSEVAAIYNYLDAKYAPEVADTVDVTGIYLKEADQQIDLYPGDEHTLTASVIPANADNTALTWSSLNPAIATVDENGKITAVKSGYTVITVTTADGGFNASCVVKVQTPQEDTLWEDIQNMRAWAAGENPEHYNNFNVMETALEATKDVVQTDDLTTLQAAYKTLREAMLALELHAHSTTLVPAADPECAKTGNTAYYTCTCGRWYLDQAATMEIADKTSVVIGALQHDWADATCTTPKTCKRTGCEATEGDALGHDWADATCTAPQTCKRDGCEATEGEPLDHTAASDWLRDQNHHWKTCACGQIVEKAAHADADQNGKCDVCDGAMKDPTLPSTGDESQVLLWAVLMLLSAAGAAVLCLSKRFRFSAK